MATMDHAAPILAALDVAATLSWYRDRLGFEVVRDDGDYGIVTRDRIELHFWQCAERHIAENTSAYIRVDDVDSLQPTLAAAANGGRISEVQTRDWGMREFYVWDPSGNLLRFGQPAVAAREHKS